MSATKGSEVCYQHGRALDIPGRYDGVLPEDMMGQFRRSMVDPKLLELRDEIALVDARTGDLLKRVDSGESGELWSRVKGEMKSYAAAKGKGDVLLMTSSLANLEDLIGQGLDDYVAWREIGRLIDRRRKLVESERHAFVEAGLMMAAAEVLNLVMAISSVIKQNIHDGDVLRSISDGIRGLLPGQDS